jgi:NDP-sugar pyrophosphorylase family protein
MRPATDTLPKSLIPVLGRPFAELQLEWLAREGVEQVIYSIGFEGRQIREAIGDGERFGVHVDYVDEGDDLRGSGGALRLALDAAALPPRFFILNGDSYLSVSFTDVESAWHASGLDAIMTVMRNNDRWDSSNATYADGRVFYDKRAVGAARAALKWIDYGLSATSSDVVAGSLQPGQRADLADLFHQLSVDGRLAGYEVSERFYEIGSPGGLRELEDHLRERVH